MWLPAMCRWIKLLLTSSTQPPPSLPCWQVRATPAKRQSPHLTLHLPCTALGEASPATHDTGLDELPVRLHALRRRVEAVGGKLAAAGARLARTSAMLTTAGFPLPGVQGVEVAGEGGEQPDAAAELSGGDGSSSEGGSEAPE